MLLIHLDNTVTSCPVINCQTEEEFVSASLPGTSQLMYSAHNGWLFVYNFYTQV